MPIIRAMSIGKNKFGVPSSLGSHSTWDAETKSVVPSVVVPSYSVGMISEQESTLSPSTDILQLTGTMASSPAGTNTAGVDGKCMHPPHQRSTGF